MASESDRTTGRGILGAAKEILLVAVGVWLAFSVESWAAARSDARQEQQYLSGLRSEFVEAEARLVNHAASQSRGLERLSWLLTRVRSADPIPHDSIADALWRGYITQYFTDPSPTYTDLVQSGRLGMIQSDSLRLALGSWNSRMQFHDLMKEKEHLGYSTHVMELATDHVPLHMIQDNLRGAQIAGSDVDLDRVIRRDAAVRLIQLRVLDSTDLRMALNNLRTLAQSIVELATRELLEPPAS